MATFGQKYAKFESKLLKNPFTQRYSRNSHYGPISQKALYRLFSKWYFFHVGEVPDRFQQEVERRYFKWNTRSKKAPWGRESFGWIVGLPYCSISWRFTQIQNLPQDFFEKYFNPIKCVNEFYFKSHWFVELNNKSANKNTSKIFVINSTIKIKSNIKSFHSIIFFN